MIDFIQKIVNVYIETLVRMVVGQIQKLFEQINNMSADVLNNEYAQALANFAGLFGLGLFLVGCVMAVAENSIAAERSDTKGMAINMMKGFIAVMMFHRLPPVLYQFCVSLQADLGESLIAAFSQHRNIPSLAQAAIGYVGPDAAGGMNIFALILVGYALIKVLFGNLKRGGILLAQICIGSLYMISIPRGYWDGFWTWAKQAAGVCVTAFLQTLLLTMGLLVYFNNMWFGIGLMLTAAEVPRIAQHFGLDTGFKANVSSMIYGANGAISLGRLLMGR